MSSFLFLSPAHPTPTLCPAIIITHHMNIRYLYVDPPQNSPCLLEEAEPQETLNPL